MNTDPNTTRDLYYQIYSRDAARGDSHGWIQWKGTDVCMDIQCKCGHHSHFDGGFFYYFECPGCHTKYAVGQNVTFIPLSEEEIAYAQDHHGFCTCPLDEDDAEEGEELA